VKEWLKRYINVGYQRYRTDLSYKFSSLNLRSNLQAIPYENNVSVTLIELEKDIRCRGMLLLKTS